MSRALLSTPSSGVSKTRPLSLEEIQQNVEDHEGRLDALDAGTQLAAAVAGTVVAGAAVVADGDGRVSGLLLANTARTASADGTGTGTIAAGAGTLQIVVVTSANADHIVILPAPVVGLIVVLLNVNIYELRTSDPATIGINGGTGANAESAIPAASTVIMICESLTNWKGLQLSSTAGTLAKVEVAA